MTKEELIKEFEEKVTCMRIYDEYGDEITDKVKDYIFNKMMPEVLEGILPEEYEWYLDYLRRKQNIKDNSRVLIAKPTIKNKYNEYKKLTPYNPCSYVSFWNYYTIEKQSFEEIVNTKFSKWWPRTLWLW